MRGSASPMLFQPLSAKRFISSQKMSSVSVAPTGSNGAPGRSSSRWSSEPACPKSQSRRPQARRKGWVLASEMAPQVARRTWSRKMEDSRCSQAFTSSERIEPLGGAGSLSTDAAGSPPG